MKPVTRIPHVLTQSCFRLNFFVKLIQRSFGSQSTASFFECFDDAIVNLHCVNRQTRISSENFTLFRAFDTTLVLGTQHTSFWPQKRPRISNLINILTVSFELSKVVMAKCAGRFVPFRSVTRALLNRGVQNEPLRASLPTSNSCTLSLSS